MSDTIRTTSAGLEANKTYGGSQRSNRGCVKLICGAEVMVDTSLEQGPFSPLKALTEK